MKVAVAFAVAVGLMVSGAHAEDVAKGDRVKIAFLDPSGPVTRGVETEFTIEVDATLDSLDEGIVRVGFNRTSPEGFEIMETQPVGHGAQHITFKVKVVPVDWGEKRKFAVVAYLGTESSEADWKPVATDRRVIGTHP